MATFADGCRMVRRGAVCVSGGLGTKGRGLGVRRAIQVIEVSRLPVGVQLKAVGRTPKWSLRTTNKWRAVPLERVCMVPWYSPSVPKGAKDRQ